jgi:inner membrane transporter RhtA
VHFHPCAAPNRLAAVPRPTRGVATALLSATSSQFGAASGAHAFAGLSPIGVVAVRQLVVACVLLPTVRPPLHRFTRAQWGPALALGAVVIAMNCGLALAVDRIGLALAVTLEFLGPLAVALLGSRSRRDLLCGLAAAAGVYVLLLPGASSDWTGIAFGLLGAAGWAGYIVLNRHVGARLPGLQAPAVASLVSVVVMVPVLVVAVLAYRPGPGVVVLAVVAGLLSNLVPNALDLRALRTVRPQTFGVLMSVQPALAAVVGLLLLGQHLAGHEWVGIAVIALTNVATVLTHGQEAVSTSATTRAASSAQ